MDVVVSLLGSLASLLFILATAAQSYKSYKDGHSAGISSGLIWMLLIGFICMTTYVISTIGFDLIMLSSLITQSLLWVVVAKYKYFPRAFVKMSEEYRMLTPEELLKELGKPTGLDPEVCAKYIHEE